MRVSIARRRRWNNILIIGIIAFIALLNLPTIVKTYLLDDPLEQNAAPHLMNPNAQLRAIYFSDWSLEVIDGQWQSSQPIDIEAYELSSRWAALAGTEVDQETFDNLKTKLNAPKTIEVWYADREEPQRITYYQLPQFWLLKNWQDKWIAVSVESSFLSPLAE
ncbi:hypothetical protein [Vibrio japonicus]|uniref:50S ribosomal protein L33 n=1 Tax=Vibrio japonicus TaxID=1824638 RepID=A0ABY5LEM1_9VIBR|nr:hypothetical protein [Vibrio japonicus]UUM30489.1 hypothetical protein NP165_12515 [Vibrio japonicus]